MSVKVIPDRIKEKENELSNKFTCLCIFHIMFLIIISLALCFMTAFVICSMTTDSKSNNQVNYLCFIPAILFLMLPYFFYKNRIKITFYKDIALSLYVGSVFSLAIAINDTNFKVERLFYMFYIFIIGPIFYLILFLLNKC